MVGELLEDPRRKQVGPHHPFDSVAAAAAAHEASAASGDLGLLAACLTERVELLVALRHELGHVLEGALAGGRL